MNIQMKVRIKGYFHHINTKRGNEEISKRIYMFPLVESISNHNIKIKLGSGRESNHLPILLNMDLEETKATIPLKFNHVWYHHNILKI